jgi:hypothetical protein
MGSGTIGVDAHPFVSHEGRPEPGQHHELQRDGDDEVADETVLGGLHTLIGIKTHATGVEREKCF